MLSILYNHYSEIYVCFFYITSIRLKTKSEDQEEEWNDEFEEDENKSEEVTQEPVVPPSVTFFFFYCRSRGRNL